MLFPGWCEGGVQQVRGGVSFEDGRKDCSSRWLASFPLLSVSRKSLQEAELKPTYWSATSWKSWHTCSAAAGLAWVLKITRQSGLNLSLKLSFTSCCSKILLLHYCSENIVARHIMICRWRPYLQICDKPVIQCNPQQWRQNIFCKCYGLMSELLTTYIAGLKGTYLPFKPTTVYSPLDPSAHQAFGRWTLVHIWPKWGRVTWCHPGVWGEDSSRLWSTSNLVFTCLDG